MKTLRLSAALAALILTASTASAAVMDFGNALGPSGGYTSQAYYQSVLGGQPMTPAQQAYGDLEDQLRQLGFLSELGGDMALGQMFYHIAYGILPPSGLDLVSGGSGLGPSSTTVSDGAAGSSSGSDAGLSDVDDDGGSVFTTTPPGNIGIDPTLAVPEASTWALMLLGFGGLGYAGWRGSRKPALPSAPAVSEKPARR